MDNNEENTITLHIPEHNTRLRIEKTPRLTTVLELERWRTPMLPGDPDTADRIRFVVLLDTDMNEALKVQHDLVNADKRMLQALFDVLHFSGTHDAVLGYDFFRKEPRVALYARYERMTGRTVPE